jgi:hypothetical protein
MPLDFSHLVDCVHERLEPNIELKVVLACMPLVLLSGDLRLVGEVAK